MIKVKIDDHEVQELFDRMLKHAGNLRQPMDTIGGLLHRSVLKNFDAQGRFSEAGSWKGGSNRWEPLSAGTLAARNFRWQVRRNKQGKVTSQGFKERKNPTHTILTVSARLRNSITWETSNDSVTVGTNVVYAAIQNFGGKTKAHLITARNKKALAWPGMKGGPYKSVKHPGSKIPARPFLVVQDEDLVQIADIMRAFLLP